MKGDAAMVLQHQEDAGVDCSKLGAIRELKFSVLPKTVV